MDFNYMNYVQQKKEQTKMYSEYQPYTQITAPSALPSFSNIMNHPPQQELTNKQPDVSNKHAILNKQYPAVNRSYLEQTFEDRGNPIVHEGNHSYPLSQPQLDKHQQLMTQQHNAIIDRHTHPNLIMNHHPDHLILVPHHRPPDHSALVMSTRPPEFESPDIMYQNRQRTSLDHAELLSPTEQQKTYSFIPLDVVTQKKRPRKKFNEVERLYMCTFQNCTKAYGTLNHLNAHVSMQNHGPKRLPSEFKELRKQLKERKKRDSPIDNTHQEDHTHLSQPQTYLTYPSSNIIHPNLLPPLSSNVYNPTYQQQFQIINQNHQHNPY